MIIERPNLHKMKNFLYEAPDCGRSWKISTQKDSGAGASNRETTVKRGGVS